jgi:predicted nucleic acid-binding protein
MSAVFADTFYFLGLNNTGDAAHSRCADFARVFRGRLVTTNLVLLELANSSARPPHRQRTAAYIRLLRADPQVEVVEVSATLFDQGLELYRQHADKDWSLTDCISFIVMRGAGIAEVATGDHHFEQAGFTVLLK